MPTDSVTDNESQVKRKVKNKVPKRLKQRNRPPTTTDDDNEKKEIHSREERSVLRKEKISPETTTPFFLDGLRLSNEPKTIDYLHDPTSIFFWRFSTRKALEMLQKQALNRRQLLIERHQERLESIRRLLYQREQIDVLTEQNHALSEIIDSFRQDLHHRDEQIQLLQLKLKDQDEVMHENEHLRNHQKSIEQKLERLTSDYNKKVEDHRRQIDENNEEIQSLLDEVERIKRDLVLEEYRKQEAERKVRYYEDKFKLEQTNHKKLQHDNQQIKQELRSIQMKYDTLQIEMLAMHKANHTDISYLTTKDTDESQWSQKRPLDSDDSMEIKGTKRKTRDRTESSASTASHSSDKQYLNEAKASKLKQNSTDESSTRPKRKTLKSQKTNKKALPTVTVTVTQASPPNDQTVAVENDSTQLLAPPTINAITSDSSSATTTDSQETSGESRPATPRVKKASRYPCRRAQRPAKAPVVVENPNQIQQ